MRANTGLIKGEEHGTNQNRRVNSCAPEESTVGSLRVTQE